MPLLDSKHRIGLERFRRPVDVSVHNKSAIIVCLFVYLFIMYDNNKSAIIVFKQLCIREEDS